MILINIINSFHYLFGFSYSFFYIQTMLVDNKKPLTLNELVAENITYFVIPSV